MIRELDRIVLTAPVPAQRLEIGDVGTFVHVYADGKAFEIGFMTRKAPTIASVRTSEPRSVTSLSLAQMA